MVEQEAAALHDAGVPHAPSATAAPSGSPVQASNTVAPGHALQSGRGQTKMSKGQRQRRNKQLRKHGEAGSAHNTAPSNGVDAQPEKHAAAAPLGAHQTPKAGRSASQTQGLGHARRCMGEAKRLMQRGQRHGNPHLSQTQALGHSGAPRCSSWHRAAAPSATFAGLTTAQKPTASTGDARAAPRPVAAQHPMHAAGVQLPQQPQQQQQQQQRRDGAGAGAQKALAPAEPPARNRFAARKLKAAQRSGPEGAEPASAQPASSLHGIQLEPSSALQHDSAFIRCHPCWLLATTSELAALLPLVSLVPLVASSLVLESDSEFVWTRLEWHTTLDAVCYDGHIAYSGVVHNDQIKCADAAGDAPDAATAPDAAPAVSTGDLPASHSTAAERWQAARVQQAMRGAAAPADSAPAHAQANAHGQAAAANADLAVQAAAQQQSADAQAAGAAAQGAAAQAAHHHGTQSGQRAGKKRKRKAQQQVALELTVAERIALARAAHPQPAGSASPYAHARPMQRADADAAAPAADAEAALAVGHGTDEPVHAMPATAAPGKQRGKRSKLPAGAAGVPLEPPAPAESAKASARQGSMASAGEASQMQKPAGSSAHERPAQAPNVIVLPPVAPSNAAVQTSGKRKQAAGLAQRGSSALQATGSAAPPLHEGTELSGSSQRSQLRHAKPAPRNLPTSERAEGVKPAVTVTPPQHHEGTAECSNEPQGSGEQVAGDCAAPQPPQPDVHHVPAGKSAAGACLLGDRKSVV